MFIEPIKVHGGDFLAPVVTKDYGGLCRPSSECNLIILTKGIFARQKRFNDGLDLFLHVAHPSVVTRDAHTPNCQVDIINEASVLTYDFAVDHAVIVNVDNPLAGRRRESRFDNGWSQPSTEKMLFGKRLSATENAFLRSWHELKPLWWREEASKSWERVFTDELTYVLETKEVNAVWVKGGYAERYLKGEIWLEVHFGVRANGNLHSYMACIEAVDTSSGNVPYRSIDDGSYWNQELMFITVGHEGQHRERMFVGKNPVVVRLQCLDFFLGGSGHLPNHLVETFLVPCMGRFREDWEAGASRWALGGESCERPRQMVKGTPHVVGDIAQDDAPASRRHTKKPEIIDIVSIFRQLMSDHSIGLAIGESIHFSLEFVQMFVRPIQLEPGILQWMAHTLYSNGEEERRPFHDPENSSRARDSRAHKGRVRDGLRQGGEAGEEITDSPPEEGLTRTSPDHHPDGCTARHTHSGSPEDA